MNAVYLGDIYSKDELVNIVANLNQVVSYVRLIIKFWDENLCPDCGKPIVSKDYFNRCSAKPDEHSLGDAMCYLKNIKECLEENAIY